MIEFKTWDWVVGVNEINSDKIKLILHIDDDRTMYDQDYNLILKWQLRHATPEEIKAGRRL